MNINYPRVTIGVCVRNCEDTIHEVIESIMAQDYPHEFMEVIFADDGSIDKTLTIIRNYASKIDIKTKIFQHEWKGLGFTRNLVVNKAEGKYIIWVDGDMILTKNFVTIQVEFMEKNPSVAIAKGRYGLHFQGNLASDLENLEFLTVNLKDPEKDSTPLGTGGAIYRVEAIRQVGGFDERITGACEDIDVEYRIRKAGWSLSITPAIFYERHRRTWRELWREYFWQGKGGFRLIRKNAFVNLHMLWPPITLLTESSRAILAYKLTRRKIAFLLPLHYFYKRAAWIFGLLISVIKNSVKESRNENN